MNKAFKGLSRKSLIQLLESRVLESSIVGADSYKVIYYDMELRYTDLNTAHTKLCKRYKHELSVLQSNLERWKRDYTELLKTSQTQKESLDRMTAERSKWLRKIKRSEGLL